MFEKELNLIKSPEVREVAEKILAQVPKYFYTIPASSTGKYHPQYALGNGGLVRHVKAAIAIAIELSRVTSLWYNIDDDALDIIIAALLVHDGWKNGRVWSKFTVHEHPKVASDVIKEIDFGYNQDIAEQIADLVITHMGQWNTNYRSSVTLPLPESDLQKFVHLCDFLASRKMLEVTKDIFE